MQATARVGVRVWGREEMRALLRPRHRRVGHTRRMQLDHRQRTLLLLLFPLLLLLTRVHTRHIMGFTLVVRVVM